MSDVKRGASDHYNILTKDKLCDLKIKDISDPDGSLLALWTPSSLLQDGLDVMSSWGFDQKQTWIWVKVKNDPFLKLRSQKDIDWNNIDWNDFLSFGMGHLGRNVHEIVLIGTQGKILSKIKNKSQRTVFFYKRTKHSQKPELLQDKLELMFPDQKYLEIFGRRSRPNWTVIGNESPETLGEDINDSINNLLKK